MKMTKKTITADVSIRLIHDPKLPFILTIDGPRGLVGDDIYFSENDGEKISSLGPAFMDMLPKGAKIESNGRSEAWISFWDDEALADFDGRVFDIRFTQTYDIDQDGDMTWIKDDATLIA
jgi:hypothetical protein